MIRVIRGNIFETEAQAAVNPVNCVGVSGAGLAKEFKKRYPIGDRKYSNYCKQGFLSPGEVLIQVVSKAGRPNYVVYFPTKEHWRSRSKSEDIERTFRVFAQKVNELKWTHIAIPALGCGLGGLDWNLEVYPMLVSLCNELIPHVTVDLYPPLDK